eukprot:g14743.t1
MVGLQRGPPTKFITDQDCRKKIDFGWNNCTNSAFLAGRAQTRKPWETHVKQQYQGEKWHVENVLDRVMKSGTNFHNGGASGSAPSPSSAAPNRPPTPPVAEPHSTTTAPEVIDLTGESSAEEDEEQGKEKGTGQGPGLFPSPIGIKRATPAGSTGICEAPLFFAWPKKQNLQDAPLVLTAIATLAFAAAGDGVPISVFSNVRKKYVLDSERLKKEHATAKLETDELKKERVLLERKIERLQTQWDQFGEADLEKILQDRTKGLTERETDLVARLRSLKKELVGSRPESEELCGKRKLTATSNALEEQRKKSETVTLTFEVDEAAVGGADLLRRGANDPEAEVEEEAARLRQLVPGPPACGCAYLAQFACRGVRAISPPRRPQIYPRGQRARVSSFDSSGTGYRGKIRLPSK